MRDQQLAAGLDGRLDGGTAGIERHHDPGDLADGVAKLQPHVVPGFSEVNWGNFASYSN
ncbi:hypothetical protein GMPD_07710 [Geomonas paludis]|uniref:Uncharacterized protein n=1 Tax=Geomonas paludis TaxID=2740185 RepID=A0A6V8MS54_9BACT|nr:hypothetical protein GMPD_07710 [Geomonas paludis]